MGRIVNLDDKKNTVTITVGGQEFAIARVTLFVRELYTEYFERVNVHAQNTEQLSPVQRIRSFMDLRREYIEPIMAAILEDNGYEYDRDWWARHVEDYETMDRFISECITKDTDDKKKEITAEDSSTSTG